MAAFTATYTSILAPAQRHHFRVVSTPIFKSHSILNFPVSPNTNTVVAPIFTAPAHISATTTADSVARDPASLSPISSWAEFAQNVSGEWDGFGADFTAGGQPIELPESVVPEAYREWEVKVFDWQTQCPTLAQSHDNSPCLMYKTIKLLPTVGCEADAATVYNIQERNISAPHSSVFAYQSTGCYVAAWPIGDTAATNNKSMELEHCLVDPSNKESRVRIIQVIEWQGSEVKLVSIKVFVEQWYGPFRNGDQLGGCAIRDSAFAATEPLKASQVSGVWQGTGAAANFHTCHNLIQEVGEERGSKTSRAVEELILLPKQLWGSVRKGENETWCEVGWLLDEGRAITSKCIFSATTDLKELVISTETASPV